MRDLDEDGGGVNDGGDAAPHRAPLVMPEACFPQDAKSGERETRTTCPYCGVGCGVVVKRTSSGKVEVAGDKAHPANFGRLCSKGAALGETLSLDDRVLAPLIGGQRASWDAALDLVAKTFSETIAQHGPDALAIYGSGQLLTEDYYVANKLMKGFIGAANIDTNSRLCMASSVAGHKRAFGSDTVPGTYEDLEQADVVVLVGSNLAWCHPVLFQRLAAAREKRGTKIVVIDPRRTATCEIADMHLAISPDSDVALFNGLLVHLAGSTAKAHDFVAGHTSGFKAAFEAASRMSARQVSCATGIGQPALFSFYDLFTSNERVVTVYSQGVNQSASGSDKVNAIINCHLVTGRIGRPGMGPFSVTGQPNAMGGREVGGLSNMLAAHMELDNPAHRAVVQDFWKSPSIADKPGLKAVELFRAVGEGRIKALWILATNPVDSMPEADAVREALRTCPFVVVSDIIRHTDTTAHAHVLLPSLGWGEKDGTVTNSERRISRQRAFLDGPGEARADWWQLAQVGQRMGWAAAFDYAGPADIFAEHARLSTVANAGARDFDIGTLAEATHADYDAMAPVQWPMRKDEAGETAEPGEKRFFADGAFFTPDRRARFVAISVPAAEAVADGPGELALATMVLNTGRIRDQWHTMTRTGKAARLMTHTAEPFVEVHPRDAARLGLEPAMLARVSSTHGSAVLRVVVTERQQRGSLFAPMHWTDQLAGTGRIGAVIDAARDPVSGQPALKQARVVVTPFEAASFAVAVMRQRPEHIDAAYWALAPIDGGWRVELADTQPPAVLAQRVRALAGIDADGGDIIEYADAASGSVRMAAFRAERLEAAVHAGPKPVAASRAWLAAQLARDEVPAAERLRILAGRGAADQPDTGPIICACLNVGANDILAAAANGAVGVEGVGEVTKAGTNCGSCRSEIGRLIDAARLAKAG